MSNHHKEEKRRPVYCSCCNREITKRDNWTSNFKAWKSKQCMPCVNHWDDTPTKTTNP